LKPVQPRIASGLSAGKAEEKPVVLLVSEDFEDFEELRNLDQKFNMCVRHQRDARRFIKAPFEVKEKHKFFEGMKSYRKTDLLILSCLIFLKCQSPKIVHRLA
jgi:hypothetical protein